jgi:hypothetical protein
MIPVKHKRNNQENVSYRDPRWILVILFINELSLKRYIRPIKPYDLDILNLGPGINYNLRYLVAYDREQ